MKFRLVVKGHHDAAKSYCSNYRSKSYKHVEYGST